MALKNQLSFGSGELDPVLFDRVTLERFQNALDTARNVMIGKTGSIISRFSRTQFKEIHHQGPVKIYVTPSREQLFEFGINSADDRFYVRVYDYNGNNPTNFLYEFIETNAGDIGFDVDNIESLTVEAERENLYIFGGNAIYRMRYGVSPFFYDNTVFDIPSAPDSVTYSGAFSGYDVDYAVTLVYEGEESDPLFLLHGTTSLQLPVNPSDKNDFNVVLRTSTADFDDYTEVRIYRRPSAGSAYGLIGTTRDININGSNIEATITDVGQAADFNNGLQSLVSKEGLTGADPITDVNFTVGTIYQGRMLLSGNASNVEAILASRPGLKENFYRDFPYDADSALLFKAGSEGGAQVISMIDSPSGLVVFTSVGVFAQVGLLSISNIFLEKRGGWIIDENIPPLVIPGALLFVDKTTNSVRQLVYSQELQGFDSIDQSIFSNHIFREKVIKSWSYQEGSAPLLLVTFDDGTFASFTYSFEHKMRAWTRHDSRYPVEQVVGTPTKDTSFFVTNKNGTRSIERTVPRFITPAQILADPEIDKKEYSALMDAISVDFTLVPSTGNNVFSLTPVIPGDWNGDLTLNSSVDNIFDAPGPPDFGSGVGNPGEIYRFFNPVDKSFIDLTYKSTVDGFNAIVSPSSDASEYSSFTDLYYVTKTITGLNHLEGEEVSVMVDGNVIASPFNDHEDNNLLDITVTGGEITIPDEYAGAITVIGRPIVSDIKTLNVSTVEQSPTMIESLTANKVYIRVYQSRGLYVDNLFPENKTGSKDGTSVRGMQELDNYIQPSQAPLIANRYKQPESKRVELTLPGDWNSQGQMSIRQVDPLHFEILSLILDLEVERRR